MAPFKLVFFILLGSHLLSDCVDALGAALDDAVISEGDEEYPQCGLKYTELLKEVNHLKEVQSLYRISFQACASKKQQSYEPGDTVEFDYVVMNHGDAYHPENSSFICPYAGIYRFDLHVTNADGFRYTARIMKNSFDEDYNSGYAEALAKDPGTHHSASNSVYLPCQKGDVIWVVTANDLGVDMSMWGGEDRRCLSNFSGRFVATL